MNEEKYAGEFLCDMTSSSILNLSQNNALLSRLSTNQTQIVGAIWGPAGTRKTFVAAYEIAAAVMQLDQRVLVCAYQNSTVDNTLRYTIRILRNEYGFTDDNIRASLKRTGNLSKVSSDIKEYFSVNFRELSVARIVGTTLYSSYVDTGHRMLQPQSFDRIVMDESGQVTPEQAWMGLRFLADHEDSTITAYGDDNQLSPISTEFAPDSGVLRRFRTKRPNSVSMLDTTYRLNSPGVDMTSEIFYLRRLKAPPHVQNRRLQQEKPSGPLRQAIDPDNTLVYLGVPSKEMEDGISYHNYTQTMITAELCAEYTRLGVQQK